MAKVYIYQMTKFLTAKKIREFLSEQKIDSPYLMKREYPDKHQKRTYRRYAVCIIIDNNVEPLESRRTKLIEENKLLIPKIIKKIN